MNLSLQRMTALVFATVLSFSNTAVAGHAAAHGKRTRYRKEIPLVVQPVRFAGGCHLFYATVSAGNFFDGLERLDTRRGTEYRKGQVQVTEFPEQIVVLIRDTVIDCSSPTMPRNYSTTALLVESLSVKGDWQFGTKSQPLEEPTLHRVNRPLQELHNILEYEVVVQCKNIPLAAQLTLDLVTESGERVVRIIGKL